VRKAKSALGSFFLMGVSGQLHAACSARCNLLFLRKSRFDFFAMELGSKRTGNFMCRYAVPLTSGDFPLYVGLFSIRLPKDICEIPPKNNACGALLLALCTGTRGFFCFLHVDPGEKNPTSLCTDLLPFLATWGGGGVTRGRTRLSSHRIAKNYHDIALDSRRMALCTLKKL
jgi:hypothetical protein